MNILAAIKGEQRKLERQLGKLQQQLDGVRAAAKALGHSANPRTERLQETSLVSGRQKEDF
jgi:hypothetical protein